ncbi:MAG: DUF4292 domain-containing protein [Chitinophagaceae bacterium]|nr:DUF4292 domain-containing protein [Chitinophagaceae bacterium]
MLQFKKPFFRFHSCIGCLTVFLLAIILLGACRSAKKIQHVISAKKDSTVSVNDGRADSLKYMKTIYEGALRNKLDYNTFSAKVKVVFQGNDGKKSDFNAFFKLQKDSVLWISINALLGIEAFRVLITPDSVKVINKLDKVAQLRSVAYLTEIARIPFTLNELQDLIIGNPIYLDSNTVSYKKSGTAVSMVSIGKLFKHLFTLDESNYRPLHSKLDDIDESRARTADITYGEYENKSGVPFSTFRKITVSEKSKLDIEMKYKQYDFNEPLNFPFNIPKNYKLQ